MIKRGGETQSVIRERERASEREREQRTADPGDTENGGTAAPPSGQQCNCPVGAIGSALLGNQRAYWHGKRLDWSLYAKVLGNI